MIYEYKGTEYEFPDDWDDNRALAEIRKDRGETEQQQTPKPESLKDEGLRIINERNTELKQSGDRSVKNIIANLGTMAKGAAKEVGYALNPVNTGKLLKGYATSPIESAKGIAKGFGQSAVGLANAPSAVAQIIEGKKEIKPWIKEPEILKPSNEVQERAAKYSSLATNALPVGEAIGSVIGKISRAPQAAGEGLKSSAKTIQNVSWKTKGTPEKVQTKLDTGAEFDLWGKPRDAYEKANGIIAEKKQQLKDRIAGASGMPDTDISPTEYIANAEKQVLNKVAPHDVERAGKMFEKMREYIAEKYGDGPIDLAEAQALKEKFGDWSDGFWDNTKKNQPVEHDVYKSVYRELKKALENKGPEGIRELNNEMSRLIDLKRDLAKRIPVEERNKVIPLDEAVSLAGAAVGAASGNPLPALLYGAQRASRSSGVAKKLYDIGNTLSPSKKKSVQEIVDNVNAKKEPVSEIGTTATENLDIPAYRRKGIDIEAQQAKDLADKIASEAKKLRITPDEYKRLADKIEAEDAAKQGMQDARLEQDVYLENLEKSPVISIDRIREMLKEEKRARGKPGKGNIPGEIPMYKKWGDNYVMPDRPKMTVADMLKNERGAVGSGPVNPQVKSDNFKQWFGDWENDPANASKVVDAEGKPLVVYHGTAFEKGEKPYYVFDPDPPRRNAYTTEGKFSGFQFTNDPDIAKHYSGKEYGEEGFRGAGTWKIKKGDTYRDGSGETIDQKTYHAYSQTFLDIKRPLVLKVGDDINTFDEANKIAQNIIESGSKEYDGIIIKNANWDGSTKAWGAENDQYIVFDPNQIKSATGNNGAFSPTNPDIRGSSALGTLGLTAGVGTAGLGGLTAYEMAKRKKERK